MSKYETVKTGLTGAEKKLAKKFGGVAVQRIGEGGWQAIYGQDVYEQDYGGAITFTFARAHGHTATQAAKELLRRTQVNVDHGRPFLVGPKTEEPPSQVIRGEGSASHLSERHVRL